MSELDYLWIKVEGVPQVGFLTVESFNNYPHRRFLSVGQPTAPENTDIIDRKSKVHKSLTAEELYSKTEEKNKRERIMDNF